MQVSINLMEKLGGGEDNKMNESWSGREVWQKMNFFVYYIQLQLHPLRCDLKHNLIARKRKMFATRIFVLFPD